MNNLVQLLRAFRLGLFESLGAQCLGAVLGAEPCLHVKAEEDNAICGLAWGDQVITLSFAKP